MAKRPTKSTGTSKVRFIMLEAEMPEGDLTQITTAIQNALQPATISGPRPPKAQVQVITASEQNDDEVFDTTMDEEVEVDTPARASPAKPRKPAKRKVVDVDLDSDTSFAAFTEQYPPKSDQDRYLAAVAFFCEHRPDIDAITADHIYTCFRKAEWPTGTKDFGQPLRNLKNNQFLDQGPSKGTYVVNHIGLAKVHKLAEG